MLAPKELSSACTLSLTSIMTANIDVVSPVPRKIVSAIMKRLFTWRRSARKIIRQKNIINS